MQRNLTGADLSFKFCCFPLRCTGVQMYNVSLIDPKVGDWLLEPEGKEKTLQSLVQSGTSYESLSVFSQFFF